MIAVALLAALLAAPLHTLASAWLGSWAPDPFVPAATWAALCLRPRQLPWAALLLGWLRAFTLGEPAGGQVLCALLALAVASRLGPAGRGRRPWFSAALLLAGTWWLGALGLDQLSSLGGARVAPVAGGAGLALGALLLLPAPLVIAWRGRRARRSAFAA